MANVAQQWGRRALDFVDAVERLSAPGVIRLFETEIRACGFRAYIMAGLPLAIHSSDAIQRRLARAFFRRPTEAANTVNHGSFHVAGKQDENTR
jgi:hypothetical protein